jgi:hypothetical protein
MLHKMPLYATYETRAMRAWPKLAANQEDPVL